MEYARAAVAGIHRQAVILEEDAELSRSSVILSLLGGAIYICIWFVVKGAHAWLRFDSIAKFRGLSRHPKPQNKSKKSFEIL
jgi:hypothetical protein